MLLSLPAACFAATSISSRALDVSHDDTSTTCRSHEASLTCISLPSSTIQTPGRVLITNRGMNHMASMWYHLETPPTDCTLLRTCA